MKIPTTPVLLASLSLASSSLAAPTSKKPDCESPRIGEHSPLLGRDVWEPALHLKGGSGQGRPCESLIARWWWVVLTRDRGTEETRRDPDCESSGRRLAYVRNRIYSTSRQHCRQCRCEPRSGRRCRRRTIGTRHWSCRFDGRYAQGGSLYHYGYLEWFSR